ncbi:hypothetical protein OROMI_017717 [Orobanche minor]
MDIQRKILEAAFFGGPITLRALLRLSFCFRFCQEVIINKLKGPQVLELEGNGHFVPSSSWNVFERRQQAMACGPRLDMLREKDLNANLLEPGNLLDYNYASYRGKCFILGNKANKTHPSTMKVQDALDFVLGRAAVHNGALLFPG